MAKKFVIESGSIRMSASIDYHREIVKDPSKCIGGGYWHMDKEKKQFFFYGKSEDFGPVTADQLKEVLNSSFLSMSFDGYSFYWHPTDHLDELLMQADDLDNFTFIGVYQA